MTPKLGKYVIISIKEIFSMTITELRRILHTEWPDIEQDTKLRILQATNPDKARTSYYSRVLFSVALDYLRLRNRTPEMAELEQADYECTTPSQDMTLDIKRAFNRLFTPEIARETMSYLLEKTSWRDLAKKYNASKSKIMRIMKKRRARLRSALRDYDD